MANKSFFNLALVALFVGVCHGRMMRMHAESEVPASFERELLSSNLRFSSRDRRDQFCESPVAKEKVSFPESIIGRGKVNFDMYSG
jgi:hypothetical protein